MQREGGLSALLFVGLTLACYRAWRLAGRDDITEPLRRPLPAFILQGVECPWCSGTLLTVAATFLLHHFVVALEPHWLLWAAAAATLVGLIGDKVDT